MDALVSDHPSIRRIQWMDICKGICILLVILLHSTSYYKFKGGAVPDSITAIVNFLSPIRMPSLIFLSGVMVNFSLRKGMRSFLQSRARTLLWPYLLWCVVWAFASNSIGKMVTAEWWLGGWYLWFLLFIIVYSVIAVVIPTRYHLIVAGYAYLISLALEDGTKYGERMFFFMSVFFVGSFLGRNLPKLEEMLSWKWNLAVLPAALGILTYSAIDGPVRYSPHDYGIIAVVVVMTMVLCYQLATRADLPRLAFLGRNSITIYLAHMPIIAVILTIFQAFKIDTFYPNFLASFTLSLLASIALIHLRTRSRIVDLLFAFPKGKDERKSSAVVAEAVG